MVFAYFTFRLIVYVYRYSIFLASEEHLVMKFSGRCGVGVGYSLPEWIARTKGAFCVFVRACERHMMLEFGFNLNQGCSGLGKTFPHLFFSTTPLDKAHCSEASQSSVTKRKYAYL